MQVIEIKSVKARVRKVKSLIKSAGNNIFAVSFVKRSDGKLRKMSCRNHVMKPQYVKAPSGGSIVDTAKHNLITVFDTNCLKYDKKGRLCGRGGFKSLPMDAVVRIKTGGEIYRIVGG